MQVSLSSNGHEKTKETSKCDWILENRSKSHIWYFEKYQIQYSRHYISVVLDYSHARLAPVVD